MADRADLAPWPSSLTRQYAIEIVASRVVLFDLATGGHHEPWIARAVEALAPVADVFVAATDESFHKRQALPAPLVRVGPSLPSGYETAHVASAARRKAGRREVELLRHTINEARAGRALHMFADNALPWLATASQLSAPLAIVLFRPRLHYPSSYGSSLTPRERLMGRVYELALASWRRRSDALALLSLDDAAAERWTQAAGAPAGWLSDPPVRDLPVPVPTRSGCVIAGRLASRKGIEMLTAAVALRPTRLAITLAGEVDPRFRNQLTEAVATMRRAGAHVELRDWWHNHADYLAVLASARCAVIPYPRHYGASGLLLDAASVGTPVVAHEWGMIGHQVRTMRLGHAVDCNDPRRFRDALDDLVGGSATVAHPGALKAYAHRFTEKRFSDALRWALRLPAQNRDAR